MSDLAADVNARGHAGLAPPAAALTATRLRKTFGATRALIDASVEFHAGEIHCLLGENGAGKSTLGKIIGGLMRADGGELRLHGRSVAFASPSQARAAGVAMVHQELSLAPHLSVRANLWLGSEQSRRPLSVLRRRRERAQAEAAMRQLGLDIDIERRVGDLPAAVQQLVEIGKSLMFSPRLIVFDEPTAMLGAVEKQRFFQVLAGLRERGVASVLVTHHIDDVMAVADRVTIMRSGEIVDSFGMAPHIDGDQVLERLTGRRPAATEPPAAPASRTPRLDIESVPFQGGAPSVITVSQGEIVGFYGVVGCGAEHIVRSLVGESDTTGTTITVRLNGRPYRPSNAAAALKAGIAYLPAGRASHCILPGRSIEENLDLSRLHRFSRFGFVAARRERLDAVALLERCRVRYAQAGDPITSLSGGNQQKVVLARAMSAARQLLVLEDATAGVDVGAKHQIHEHIRAAALDGLAVVMLSSDLGETIALCDTVYTMYAGAVAGRYSPPSAEHQAAIVSDVLGQRQPAQPDTHAFQS